MSGRTEWESDLRYSLQNEMKLKRKEKKLLVLLWRAVYAFAPIAMLNL